MIKRLVILLVISLAATQLCAQHYFGIRGGAGNGSVRFYPPQETKPMMGLYSAGISYKYYSREKVLGGLEADLLYIQKGYRKPEYDKPDTTYNFQVNAIELPFFMQPHFYLGGRSVRLFLNLGVTLSYNLNASYETVSKKNGVLDKGDYQFELVRDNRWGYGLCGGFGVNYIMNRIELMAEARYNFGYGDIYKNHNKYPGNPQRSPLDNVYIHAGVYYRLGKGGILSEATQRASEKMSEREAKRIEKQSRKQEKETGQDTVLPPAAETDGPEVRTVEPADTNAVATGQSSDEAPAAQEPPATDGVENQQ